QAIAPVTAVYGNVDPPEIRSRLPQVASAELDGFEIVVTHGDQFGHPTPEKLHAAFPRAEIIVYGHTHKPLLELVDKTVTVMNPGAAGQPRFDLKPSVGIIELEPGIPPRGRLVPLCPAGLEAWRCSLRSRRRRRTGNARDGSRSPAPSTPTPRATASWARAC